MRFRNDSIDFSILHYDCLALEFHAMMEIIKQKLNRTQIIAIIDHFIYTDEEGDLIRLFPFDQEGLLLALVFASQGTLVLEAILKNPDPASPS